MLFHFHPLSPKRLLHYRCKSKSFGHSTDFVAFNEEEIEYYQVSLSVMDEHTLQRELAPLNSILDHNPKYLLTMDPIPLMSHNGIRQIYVLDWLLEKNV